MLGSVKNAINIINSFSIETPELGICDIADRLEMNRSTVHHIVKSLSNEGILVRTKSRRYRLGSQLLGWGQTVTEQYKDYLMATPYIDSLVKRTQETVLLAILENEEVCCLSKVEPNKAISMNTKIGDRKPLHCSGAGKILLAYQTEKSIKKVLSKKLIRKTNNTITDPNLLAEELKLIKKRGYAFDHGEYEENSSWIAVPIYNFLGDVTCSLSLSISKQTLNDVEAIKTVKNQLLLTSQNISRHCDF
ncbi:IclR family transcriptional regulator [Alkalihalobacillus sp. MEB130]|uniref:IclR family transcriptional regulator n=1 Tax=Alkalihalobacillus sp. MEB130 TaxID=2976704 RepID=UPI0028DE8DBF|nr:IclR family transcriptional regulator [Alkalihalobacillus sp. MEB130]MDT8860732.1 IclR family transcriptional regulator [Alkalihalobacillus sp. MEB130]